ncbi:MAG: 30S ribosomal protein S13 [Microgenomates group bacterium]
MVRIVGVDIKEEKRIDIGLTDIYGIGKKTAWKILKEVEISPSKRVKELTAEEISRLQKAIEKIPVEGTLRGMVTQDIERLKSIHCYRGVRHIRNLPVRGQRTRSNARTKRGKRKTVGALKKKDLARLEAQAKKEGKNES